MDLKEIIKQTSTQIKDEFLIELIQSNSKLRNSFLKIIDVKFKSNKITYDNFVAEISSEYRNLKMEIENLDFENFDWEFYTPRHSGYIPEYEATQHMSEDAIDNVFASFEDLIVEKVIKKEIELVFAKLIAIYKIVTTVEINDPYENVGGYLDSKLDDYLKMAVDKISISKIDDDRLLNVIQLIFKYLGKGNEQALSVFEEILIFLLNKIEDKSYIMSINELTDVSDKYFPRFSLKTEELIGDENSWLKNALKNINYNNDVAKQVLNYYLENNFVEYIKIAKKLFNNDRNFWSVEIEPNIKFDDDNLFYKQVVLQLCIKNNKIKDYIKIKDYLSVKEKEYLLKNINYRDVYKVEIYNEEKEYDKIKEIVLKNISLWSFEDLIKPILNIYPEFCFKIIKNKATKIISEERGRSAYEQIVSLLLIAKQILDFKLETQNLIMKFYNNKPNLPALKDEFIKAKLVIPS